MPIHVTRFPTGMVLFGPLPDAPDMYLMWLGSGTRLNLAVKPYSGDGVITRIDHPSANGVYDTLAQAKAAANAFVDGLPALGA